jgi:molecular chaperone DnaK
MKLGEAVYGANKAPEGGPEDGAGEGGAGRGGKANGDNVVDADFEEVKDDKKRSA